LEAESDEKNFGCSKVKFPAFEIAFWYKWLIFFPFMKWAFRFLRCTSVVFSVPKKKKINIYL
jgi:hypothetical protein